MPRFSVRLTALGFQVFETATGTPVRSDAEHGCQRLQGQPVFASRIAAQRVADDLNDDAS